MSGSWNRSLGNHNDKSAGNIAASGNNQVRYCNNCGARMDAGARFCSRCGKISSPSNGSHDGHHAQRGHAQNGAVPARQYDLERKQPDNHSPSGKRNGGAYGSYGGRLSADPQAALDHVTSRMKSSGTIWLLIGIYQLLVGLVTLFLGYGIFPIAVGIWNITNSSKQKRTAAEYAANPIGIISAYENAKSMSIVFIIVNLILGAGFGVLGSIYDLSTCNYVLSHKDAFGALERMARCA